ncbi:hypothetical protein TOPH_06076 [Tolypocladium ophioglossoides CBS 100239]|uniref:Kinesin light chain n=1 Tax=Tolypocladium ophioglossoides (strain CBS 100239) TaxID=1163406 RepID=A0A0L0N5V5_TOLOC|nr:hypothetical protein TOPH_06076 [Tolypocladium ophioglossoides CBS 100239]
MAARWYAGEKGVAEKEAGGVEEGWDDLLTAGTTSLCQYFPFSHKGSILFTTRNHEAVRELDIRLADVIFVAEMSRPEAEEMLQRNLPMALRSDFESTTRLLDFLADLPLAIKQASAYMDNTRMTTAKYLAYCQEGDKTRIKLLSKNFNDLGRYKGTQNPILTTWLVSFRLISRKNALAAKYLQFMSFLVEKGIPKQLLPPGKDELQADEAIGMLKSYAFITAQDGHELYQMHRLVRLAMRNWLAVEGTVRTCVTGVIQRLNNVFPFPTHENRMVWMGYLPHALTTLELRDGSTVEEATPMLLSKVASSNFLLGKYSQADTMHREALKLRTTALGAEHPDTLRSMETLEIRPKALGAEHPDTLWSMDNLANALDSQGKHVKGRVRLLRRLELAVDKLFQRRQT